MENNYDVIKQKFKLGIVISEIKNENDIIIKKQKNINRKPIAVACMILVLATGVVFAKDIENLIKDRFRLGNGVEKAIENNYIGTVEESEYKYSEVSVTKGEDNNIVDKFDTGMKINSFVMTDTALSLEIELKFDEKINKYKKINNNTDFENFGNIEFSDLFVLDNEKILIHSPSLSKDEELFKNYCENNNLEYTFGDYNNKYLTSVANSEIRNINSNTLTLTYIIQASDIPKSKTLKLNLSKIKFLPKKQNKTSDIVTLTGNWCFEIEVPELIYNRTSTSYYVVDCENKDFDVYEAKVTDTGFEIGLTIDNVEAPVADSILINPSTELPYIFNSKEELLEISTDKDFENKYVEFETKFSPIRVNGVPVVPWLESTEGCYVENSNGEKFCASNSAYRKQNSNFLDNRKFEFYETFDMTSYEATDTITVTIELYGIPYKIKMQKFR